MSLLEVVLDLPRELLFLWHSYRVPVLASALVICAAFVLVQARRPRRSNFVSAPLVSEDASAQSLKGGLVHSTNELVETTKEKIVPSQKPGPRKITGQKPHNRASKSSDTFNHTVHKVQPLLFFSSLSGTTEAAAKQLLSELESWAEQQPTPSNLLKPLLHDISYTELDDFFISAPKDDPSIKFFYIILLPSYDIDTILTNFTEHLKETHHDFRIDTAPLSGIVGYSVFGFGDKESWPTEEEGFCYQAKEVDKWLAKLTSRKRAYPLGLGDVKSDSIQRLDEWRVGVQEALVEIAAGRGLGEGIPGSGAAAESEDEEDVYEEGEVFAESAGPEIKLRRTKVKSARVDDLEDLGKMVQKESDDTTDGPIAIDFTTYKPKASKSTKPLAIKEMVPKNSPTYASLTKQGYSIIGSHSGVKICRWTKSALRGRGSCYKYSFYGIASHLCMEATPSLSCSNKCVFCWRHGSNPVGTTWRWVTDPPEMIFDGITAAHYKKIKMMKGVPGVRAERFAEAMRIRHCALSLVGEPIFYPHINSLLSILHANRISSFLVGNAQHPEQLATLIPVTQLYVSIDASNKDSLRRIDRPLHRDFWERFLACLDILRARRHEQRTVFRLTLVKGFNIEEEVTGYADLIERSLPAFVEVKGVTYCGTSASSSAGLTMQNVPFYAEVCEFVNALNAELERRELGYGIAVEHAHSCCVLIASERFKINGQWCTRIDYDKFFELVEGGKPFSPEDYIGQPTPEWALWGNGGFDPRDERVIGRKGKRKHEVTSVVVEEE